MFIWVHRLLIDKIIGHITILYIHFSGTSSSDDGEVKYTDDEDSIDDYDIRFAKYKECVKAEEHCFYNCVLSDTSSESSDLDE